MDGDLAPVPELLALAERHDAWLVVDDAHGIGVLGKGRGTLAHFGIASERIVYMATLGKALGGYGAFVTGAPEVVEWLLQRARPYVFSTALPPSLAAAATAALSIVSSEPERIERLHARIAAFRDGLAASGHACGSASAIQPVLVGEPARAVALSARLREQGHLVPAIRPPTVPAGTSRLRVSLSSEHTGEQVGALVRDLAQALAE
jgi:8-amino-7-oxononanoate synthase